MSILGDTLRGAMKRPATAKTLDSAAAEPGLAGADDYTVKELTLAAASTINQWAEADDLDDGESYADRLMAMFVGIADENQDGEIGEDEQAVLDVALNAGWDYLVNLGVSEDDATELLNEWDADVADRIRELVASVLPEGEDAASDAVDSFVFSEADQEPALDAAYRRTVAIRRGKKVVIRKRVSGSVRLSAKQKVAIKKARLKSNSASARMRRAKSNRLRKKFGLG